MRFADLIRLAAANLQRNRTRSVMTLVGVMIGVAALMALLSYGAGLQRNARNEFNALELYNTLRVTSRPNPFDDPGNLAFIQQQATPDTLLEVPLTDSLVAAFARIEGVLAAFPEVVFPVTLEAGERIVATSAVAVPMAYGEIASYRPVQGRFFTSEADSALLLSPSMAKRLGFEQPEDILGQTITLNTALLDIRAMATAMQAFTLGMRTLPVRTVPHRMQVIGLLEEEQQALSGLFRIVLPLELAKGLQKVTFFSTMDLLMSRSASSGYMAVRVQLRDASDFYPVRQALERHGVFVTSFREQFVQVERLFLLMDLGLAIIGCIALLVATIGIANTMMMNVMERYREIGVMKAVGGDEGDLQRLFLVESALLGMVGGLLGLLLGFALTRLIGWGVNLYLSRLNVPHLDVFYLPLWMLLAILGVALLVSLAAGVVPARRAARIEPIAALRSP